MPSTKRRAQKTKLVTIIACWTLQRRIEELLAGLDVTNYTLSLVDARGARRGSKYAQLESGHVKVEALVAAGAALRILDAVDRERADVTAFVYDVEAAARGSRSRAA